MSKILFLSNHFLTLHSFRKELIIRLVNDGHSVYISTPEDEQNVFFTEMGCVVIPTEVSRRGMNPINDMKLLFDYKRIIKKVNPDIIFSYTIKPNIYGALANNRTGIKQICNITGTGATFLEEGFLSKLCRMLYKLSVKRCHKVFFQNSGDKDYFVSHNMVSDNFELIPGSGCNLDEHPYVPPGRHDTINFIFVGRVMKLKGIDEYLECAKIVRQKYPDTVFYIAGWNEEEKYKAIVADYHDKGIVNYIGFRKDINEWIKKCDCIILPSYGGEGVPNVLLEAAATGRACIASEINGSKDVVTDGVNGYLFKPGDATDLIEKVEKFICLSEEEKINMGIAGRDRVEKHFNREFIVKKYLNEVENNTTKFK